MNTPKTIRLVAVTLLLPVALLFAAYLSWSLWSVPLVRALLADAGVELLSAELERPGWQGVTIHNLKVRYPASGLILQMSAPALALGYSWSTLKQGDLESVYIAEAELRVAIDGSASKASDTDSTALLTDQILPQALFAKLPVSNVDIQQLALSLPASTGGVWLEGQLKYDGQQLALGLADVGLLNTEDAMHHLTVNVDNQNRLQLKLLHNQQTVVIVDSQIDAKPRQLMGRLHLNLSAASEFLKQFQLLAAEDQLSGNLQVNWQLPVPEEITPDSLPLNVDLELLVSAEATTLPAVQLAAFEYSNNAQLQLSPDDTRLELSGDSRLNLETLMTNELVAEQLSVIFPNAVEINFNAQQVNVPELSVQLDDSELLWLGETYQFASASFELRGLSMSQLQQQALSGQLFFAVERLGLPIPDWQLTALDLAGQVRLNTGHLSGDLTINDTADLLTVQGAFKHNMRDGDGHLTAQLQPVHFKQSQRYLPQWIKNWPYPFDLFAGQVSGDGQLSWQADKVDLSGQLLLEEVAGFYDNNLFRGLNAEIAVSGPLQNPALKTEQLKVANLDVGFPINNVSFSLQADSKEVQVNDFRAELLGGQVSQKGVRYDFEAEENNLLLNIEGVQLAELLSLENGVEGLGVLDGYLPLRISSDGFVVPKGEIKARSPGGYIRYQGAKSMTAAVADVGVAFALEALENFHYDVLDVQASYSPDGQLKLATQLLGRNPDMSEQRPVRYNINIQENIPALIQSLKLTQQISDDIERRIQAFYKQNRE